VDLSAPVGTLRSGGSAIPCYAALGDQQCALFGADLQRDELSINVSTGSQVSRRTERLELGDYQTRFYLGSDYLNTITHIPAGRSLNVLVEFVTEYARHGGGDAAGVWDYIASATATADGGGLECDLSFFKGPFGEHGRIEGITTENLTVGNLFRAAFETMSEYFAVCAARLQPHEFSRIALTGGLPQSVPVLRRLIVERFGLPVREPAAAEETLLGLLRAAATVLQRGEGL
jgi:sugar (pentulose or hexulose) kinase